DREALRGVVSSPLPQRLADPAWHHATETAEAGSRTRPGSDRPLDRPRLAPHPQKGATENAHVVLIDEGGVLLNPLVRRSLAPRGRPLILRFPWRASRKGVGDRRHLPPPVPPALGPVLPDFPGPPHHQQGNGRVPARTAAASAWPRHRRLG